VPRKPKTERRIAGRYSQAAVRAEIRAAIDRKNERGTHKQLSIALGLALSQQLTHRMKGAYEFSVEELGAAADFFEAPIGWPFIPWAIAEKLAIKK
jgi:hypothetical protein